MSDALTRVAELVRRQSGLRVDPDRRDNLLAALGRVSPDLDATGFLRLADQPALGAEVVAKLIDELTVKETSFLRDRRQLETIDWHALHASAQGAGSATIRVWSAACATGEEPYSLALLACEAFGSLDPPVQILATDISAGALALAELARYRARPLRAVEPGLRNRYFVAAGDRLEVSAELKRLVRFAPHNLAHASGPPVGSGPFELILCRNVLIYFDADTVDRVVAALDRALAPGGRLLLGAADALADTMRRLGRLSPATASRHGPQPRARARQLRRPLGLQPEPSAADLLADALRHAGEGRAEESLAIASGLMADDALNPDLHFLCGLIELESGDPAAAVWSLRRALYLDPDFGMAAFKLGRAHEAAGEHGAALRAYERALVALERGNERDERHLDKIEVADVLAACSTRLEALAAAATNARRT